MNNSNGQSNVINTVGYIEDIQMFVLNMSFISRVKWTIFIFHEWQSHKLNIIIVHFTSEIKDIFNKKHLNFLFYYLQISHNILR